MTAPAGIRLPTPEQKYDPGAEQRRNQVIEQALNNRLQRFVDIEVAVNRIILTSPNGTRYELTVDDAGVLGANPV